MGLRLGKGFAENAVCGENSAATWMIQLSWPCGIRSIRHGRTFCVEFTARVGESQCRPLWLCSKAMPFSVEGISFQNNNFWCSSGPWLKQSTWAWDVLWWFFRNGSLCGEFHQVCQVIIQVWPKTPSCNSEVVYPELMNERKWENERKKSQVSCMGNVGSIPAKTSVASLLEPVKKQRCYFANKGPSNQSFGFSSSRVWRWELDCKEGWAPKNWSF